MRKQRKVEIVVEDPVVRDTAVVYGVQLARHWKIPAELITIQRVVPSHYSVGDMAGSYSSAMQAEAQLIEKRMDQLEKMSLELKSLWPEVGFRHETGFPEAGILDLVEEEQPYILTVGRRRSPGLVDEIFGTRATRIAKKAACPVLVVPPKATFQPFQHYLFLIDKVTPEEWEAPVRFLMEQSLGWDVRITLVVNKRSETGEDETRNVLQLRDKLKSQSGEQFRFEKIYETEDFSGQFQKLGEQLEPDCLLVNQRDSNFFERLLSDDSSEHIILNAEKPVIVF